MPRSRARPSDEGGTTRPTCALTLRRQKQLLLEGSMGEMFLCEEGGERKRKGGLAGKIAVLGSSISPGSKGQSNQSRRRRRKAVNCCVQAGGGST